MDYKDEKNIEESFYKVDKTIDIHFQNISYSVKRNIISTKKINILKSVSGRFKAGQLTAIIGASGAGKTTLLNIISGYTTKNVEGAIFDNGELRKLDSFNKLYCYIMQDGKLHPLLTVQEAMNFAADLNIPVSSSPDDKNNRIRNILKSLGLYECRNTLTNNLSGGERRRLSIGVELIQNPPVFFIDEPTSGLDDVAAKKMISLLANLAHEGRTIICTIHQPSAVILNKFDQLYCLYDGRCTYQGAVNELLPYLQTFDPPLICPNYHNPADFLLEVCNGDYGNVSDLMVEKCKNNLVDCDTFIENNKVGNESVNNNIYLTSSFHQTIALIKRIYMMIRRDKQLTVIRICINIITSIFISIMYYNVGDDGRYTVDSFKYIFFTFMWVTYTSVCTTIIGFSNELPILIREHFNHWYSVKSYFFAVTLADLPIQIISMFSFLLISYYMTGQPLVWYRFSIFTILCFLNCLVAQSLGVLISSLTEMKASVLLGPVSLTPFIIFCGFFLHAKDAPYYLQWAFDFSFMRYAMEGGIQAVMGFDRGKLNCPTFYCHFANPAVFLKQVGINEPRIMFDVVILVGHYVAFKWASYFALANRIGGRK